MLTQAALASAHNMADSADECLSKWMRGSITEYNSVTKHAIHTTSVHYTTLQMMDISYVVS